MKRIIVLLVVLSLLSRGFLGAQSVTSAYDMAVAGADLFTPRAGYLEQSPATINQFQGRCIALHQVAPYFIPELRYNTISLVEAEGKIKIAADYRLQSFESSRKHSWAISSGIQINQDLQLGLKVRYDLWNIQEEKYAQSWLSEIGLIYEFNEQFALASQFQPMFQDQFDSRWFGQMRSAMQYKISQHTCLQYALLFDRFQSLSQQLSFSKQVLKNFKALAGISTEEPHANMGVLLQWKKIGIQNSFSYHSSLGLSTCVGISLQY